MVTVQVNVRAGIPAEHSAWLLAKRLMVLLH